MKGARIALPVAAVAGIALQVPGRLPWPILAALLVLGTMALWDPPALRRMGGPRFWLLTAGIALATGLVLARPTHTLGPVPVSLAGLAAAGVMLGRAVTLYGIAVIASRNLSPALVQRAASRLGLGALGTALSVAWSVMPTLVAAAQAARQDPAHARLRGLARLEAMAVDLLVQAMRLAASSPPPGGPR
jgi:hypothetical protein